ncbi:hypothetical protein NSK_005895 [Nannochloropsis salina CCMP1776]|uniref:Uncharacterized protein n=1 Tax=Nannochloropsis salina CCMP1776 TaxID=1027361 RepID=A0A4D9CUD7_9STRA|nr:hypothetical protein NSK_005895 [Nannochloropsis salina CCMP1776]|eukprot:TFJ82820.1 hypothetical protein NSK_005895 [Nannochloropsis salina CCMP1776]
MPLITICGQPASGKTTFAHGLVEYLKKKLPTPCRPGKGKDEEDRGSAVVLVNEEALPVLKAEGYRDATAEKITRGELKSKVDHALNRDTVVVVDSLNYIKGFRYQLYCMARAETTQHCVVWVALEHQQMARAWNESREDRYPPELYARGGGGGEAKGNVDGGKEGRIEREEVPCFDDLWGRFEAPVEGNRWDRPLICYSPRPPSEGAEEKEGRKSTREEVYQQVLAAVTEGKAPAAGLSTATAPRNDADALYLLDQVTQRLLFSILERQKTSMPGDIITVPEARTPVCFRRHVGLPELKRLRRQFLKQASDWAAATLGGGGGDKEGGEEVGKEDSRERAVGDAFVQYLNLHTT